MKRVKLIAGIIVSALVALAGVGWVVWALMALVPANWARLWALLATLGVPSAGIFCYWLGTTEARGLLRGLDLGVSKIFGTTVRAARRRSYMGMATQFVNPRMIQSGNFVLPDVEFVDDGVSDTVVSM